MEIKIGSIVTRNSYKNDIVFKVVDIEDNIYILTGINIRLIADSPLEDLKIYTNDNDEEEREFLKKISIPFELNRDDYFYLPGKILHIDTEFQLTNTLANPYKIRKKTIFKNCKNHQKCQKNGNFYKMYYTQL